MKGIVVIDALKRKLRVETDSALGGQLGITNQAIQNWKKRPRVTPRQMAGLVSSSAKISAKQSEARAIRPVVEFFPIKKTESKQGAKFELFAISNDLYRQGVRNDLLAHKGIYLFFDSRGRAIYAGKARQQNLWNEMKSAFNRDRGAVQSIKRVHHPERKQKYRNSDEKSRQIVENIVPLHDLAMYFSAYNVAPGLIDMMEAMLVRSFANDLLNARMEKFAKTASKTTATPRKKRRQRR